MCQFGCSPADMIGTDTHPEIPRLSISQKERVNMRLLRYARGCRDWLIATIIALAAGLSMLAAAPATSAAAAVPRTKDTIARTLAAYPSIENYSKRVYIHARCAFYKGEIAWGRHDVIGEYYVETSGLLSAVKCHEGKTILHLHYDTVDNPRTPLVGAVQHGHAKRVALTNEDWLNSYKDIYVELCYVGSHGACVRSS